jgi:hypothetical protein
MNFSSVISHFRLDISIVPFCVCVRGGEELNASAAGVWRHVLKWMAMAWLQKYQIVGQMGKLECDMERSTYPAHLWMLCL